MLSQRSRPPSTAVAAAMATLGATLATFLPWASSGDRVRNSYEVVDVAGRAGVLSESTEALAGLWFVVPPAAGLVLVALALRAVLLVGAVASSIGVTVVAGGLLVARSPLGAEPGLFLASGLGFVATITGISTLIMTKRRHT